MARSFTSGSSQYLQRTSDFCTGSPPITLMAWCCAPASTTLHYVLAQSQTSNKYYSLECKQDGSGNPVWYYRIKVSRFAGIVLTYAVGGAMTGVFHHFCGVSRSATDHELYIDGTSRATSSTSADPAMTSGNIAIGRHSHVSPPGYYTGRIEYAAILNGALSDEQVKALAPAIEHGTWPPSVEPELFRDADSALWPLLGHGSTEQNLVGSGYQLTAYNSPPNAEGVRMTRRRAIHTVA